MEELIKGLMNKEPEYIDLGNHMGNPQEELLTDLPFKDLGELGKIKLLTAKNHAIRKVSPEIGKMKSLQWLDLSENPLEELPVNFGELESLKFFRASDTIEVNLDSYLTDLLEKPGHHPEFTSNAGLKTLPESFGNLQNLEALRLDGNRFEEIPECVFQLENLSYLDLRGNLLGYISPHIEKLAKLSYLQLSRNNFHELPETLGNLKKLTRLRLDALELETLPESIGELDSLQMLEICYGRIYNIPPSIKHLKNLGDIYLINTEVSEIDLNMLKVLLPQTRIHVESIF